MKRIFFLLFLWQCAGFASADVRVVDAWIPAAPPTMTVFAAYMTIENTDAAQVNVAGFRSPHFDLIEMHHTTIKDGMAEMNQQKLLAIPANGTLALEPQSWHLMLIGPAAPVNLGDEIRFTVILDNGREFEFSAEVKSHPLQ